MKKNGNIPSDYRRIDDDQIIRLYRLRRIGGRRKNPKPKVGVIAEGNLGIRVALKSK
jgi:hypothetical protein